MSHFYKSIFSGEEGHLSWKAKPEAKVTLCHLKKTIQGGRAGRLVQVPADYSTLRACLLRLPASQGHPNGRKEEQGSRASPCIRQRVILMVLWCSWVSSVTDMTLEHFHGILCLSVSRRISGGIGWGAYVRSLPLRLQGWDGAGGSWRQRSQEDLK